MQVTISAEGEIVIPKSLREVLAFEPGAALEIEVVAGDQLVIRKAGKSRASWRSMQGMLAGDGPDLLKELQAERAEEIARDERKHPSL